jgi:hypothetical protein
VVKLFLGGQSFTAERPFGYKGAGIALHADHLATLFVDQGIASTVADIALTLIDGCSRPFIIANRFPFFGTPFWERPVPGKALQLFPDGSFGKLLRAALRAEVEELFKFPASAGIRFV